MNKVCPTALYSSPITYHTTADKLLITGDAIRETRLTSYDVWRYVNHLQCCQM